jgi:hypothetical protein
MKSFVNFIPKKGYEGLTVDDLLSMTVAVHWNSRDKLYSIVHMKSKHSEGLVIGYSENITLENCYVHIRKSEQLKVRNGTHKNRHAFICGTIVDFEPNAFANKLYYNPRKLDSFVEQYAYIEHGIIDYIDHMDYVALAKIQSKNKPFVTFKKSLTS